jgi:hypothetical protein
MLKKTRIGFVASIIVLVLESFIGMIMSLLFILKLLHGEFLGLVFLALDILLVFASIMSIIHLIKIKNIYFVKDEEAKKQKHKSAKQIFIVFVSVLLTISLLITASGFIGYKVVKPTDLVEKDISTELNEQIDTSVNKEEKQAFYNSFDITKIKPYGNTIVAKLNSTDAMMYIQDDGYASFTVMNQYTAEGEKVHYSAYEFANAKTNEHIKTVANIQVIEGTQMKEYWIDIGVQNTIKPIVSTAFKQLNNIPISVMAYIKNIEYMYTSTDGIDTIKCIAEDGIEVIFKVNTHDNTLHHYHLKTSSTDIALLFTNTDTSTITVPENVIKSYFQSRYLTEKYISELSMLQ